MTFQVILFVWRKPGLSPADFKTYWETKHVPLVKELTGDKFPNSHTRHYIQRSAVPGGADNTSWPAAVMLGEQSDFDYDAWAVLDFDSKEAFEAMFAKISEKDAAERLGADEEAFLDRGKRRVVFVDDMCVTSKS